MILEIFTEMYIYRILINRILIKLFLTRFISNERNTGDVIYE